MATTETSSDEDEFDAFESNAGSRRYPVHDCCEFEDVESLRRLIFVRQEESDDDDTSASSSGSSVQSGSEDDDSSTDDEDSNAAARAAAVGHSPPQGAHDHSTACTATPIGATAAVAAGVRHEIGTTADTGHDIPKQDHQAESGMADDEDTHPKSVTSDIFAAGKVHDVNALSAPDGKESNDQRSEAMAMKEPAESDNKHDTSVSHERTQAFPTGSRYAQQETSLPITSKPLSPIVDQRDSASQRSSIVTSETEQHQSGKGAPKSMNSMEGDISTDMQVPKSRVANGISAPTVAQENSNSERITNTNGIEMTGVAKVSPIQIVDTVLTGVTGISTSNQEEKDPSGSTSDMITKSMDLMESGTTPVAAGEQSVTTMEVGPAADGAGPHQSEHLEGTVFKPVVASKSEAVSSSEPQKTVQERSNSTQSNSELTGKSKENQKLKKKKKKKAKKPRQPSYYCPYDLDERDEDENTPLHVAVHARKIDHVRLLLEAGCSVHKKCDGSPPIHTAISIGSIPSHADFSYDCVRVLKDHGADLSAKDDSLHTPLYLACMMNLPRVVGLLLSDPDGIETLNLKADRVGGRALHAAAKFDMPTRGGTRSAGGAGGSTGSGHHNVRSAPVNHHHHHTSILHRGHHHHPGLHRSHLGTSHPSHSHQNNNTGERAVQRGLVQTDTTALLTQVLLTTPGIEVDPQNNYGRTPLHIACTRGNWSVVRHLLNAGANPLITDRRGFTPGYVAHKRGMVVPNDLLPVLGQAPPSFQGTPARDLIMDPDGKTVILCHELCSRHRSCPPITRGNGMTSVDPPPENVRRLHVLINEDVGILRCGEFSGCSWETEARRAAMADVLKVHEYTYVEKISQLCSSIPDHPNAVAALDADTAVSRWSFEAAMRAAGSVCEAVDRVMAGDFRNAFCAVRPPGHHAGPRGIVKCLNDHDGSHGFCLLNNVAIGAAYARSMYRNDGIHKVAIIDFDVHHGNGTEEIVRQLVPGVEQAAIRTPFALGALQTSKYRPWLDENDIHDVFFASTHGYGPKDIHFADQPQQAGWFYPASGKTHTSDAILNPSTVENPNTSDFLLSQTWTRMGEESRANCCKIINCGLSLPGAQETPGMQRVELRDAYRKNVLPHLMDFDPDIIFISAGFDAHKKDTMNFGYVGMIEDDYEWVTEQLVRVANTCCNGRIISVLEGGYKIHGGIVSPFARSVASHVRALVDGGSSRELYDSQEGEWESQFERHMIEEKEKKRQIKIDKLHRLAQENQRRQFYTSRHHASMEEQNRRHRLEESQDMEAILKEPLNDHRAARQLNLDSNDGVHHDVSRPDQDEEPRTRKRRRNQVDYVALYEQMKKEGFAG